jgi:hypothetical protein
LFGPFPLDFARPLDGVCRFISQYRVIEVGLGLKFRTKFWGIKTLKKERKVAY